MFTNVSLQLLISAFYPLNAVENHKDQIIKIFGRNKYTATLVQYSVLSSETYCMLGKGRHYSWMLTCLMTRPLSLDKTNLAY